MGKVCREKGLCNTSLNRNDSSAYGLHIHFAYTKLESQESHFKYSPGIIVSRLNSSAMIQ